MSITDRVDISERPTPAPLTSPLTAHTTPRRRVVSVPDLDLARRLHVPARPTPDAPDDLTSAAFVSPLLTFLAHAACGLGGVVARWRTA